MDGSGGPAPAFRGMERAGKVPRKLGWAQRGRPTSQ